MNDPQGHAGWFRDVRRILDITEVTPGLPIPFISSDRASYYFTAITRAEDAAEAVRLAETVFAYALGVTFAPPVTEQTGTTRRDLYCAILPSGLIVSLVAVAGLPVDREDAPRKLAAVA
jgi:hypothetical protein